MKVVVQRVKSACVIVNNQEVSSIKKGFLLFVGFHQHDTIENVYYLAKKIAKLRIFSDEQGKMNLSIDRVDGNILSVSQFTLYANTLDGNRPSFTEAMNPKDANELYLAFNTELERLTDKAVQTGVFQTEMEVQLVNDGPVTILMEK